MCRKRLNAFNNFSELRVICFVPITYTLSRSFSHSHTHCRCCFSSAAIETDRHRKTHFYQWYLIYCVNNIQWTLVIWYLFHHLHTTGSITVCRTNETVKKRSRTTIKSLNFISPYKIKIINNNTKRREKKFERIHRMISIL